MRLSKLIETLDGEWIGAEESELEIFSLTTDSRKRVKNSLFICLKGGDFDGHDFAREAVKNGSIAIIAERKVDVKAPQFIVADTREALAKLAAVYYGNPSKRLKIVGITGTNGKTTTARMLAEILKYEGKEVGIIGTLGIEYGKKYKQASLTTPDPIELQQTFSDMYASGVEYVVMEVSAHALFFKKIEGISFFACIFTNFTQDHLDFFKTMDAYKKAKLALFGVERCPLAIVNGDEEVGREIAALREKNGGKTLFYGMHNPADSFAIVTQENLRGSECMLNLSDNLCRVSLSLTGLHNVYNALAAATCAMEIGVEPSTIAAGLTSLKGVRGRLERVGSIHGAEIYVDFAHTPDGLAKSLAALKKHCQGRLICLFGCGGNRDKIKRPFMGETVAKLSDFAVLTSDNPRYEDPLDIISDIEKGYRRFSARYVVVPDRKKAIDYALDFVKKGDVFLVAGKGGEDYQEIMGIKYPFNDHTVIDELLTEKKKNPFNG